LREIDKSKGLNPKGLGKPLGIFSPASSAFLKMNSGVFNNSRIVLAYTSYASLSDGPNIVFIS